jgi:hypothetical protein
VVENAKTYPAGSGLDEVIKSKDAFIGLKQAKAMRGNAR